jgi:hypothetical protein
MTDKKEAKPEDKKIKVANLRKLHQSTFESLGIPEALFIPKCAYRPTGKDELYISFFPSELQRGQDIYTEFVSFAYDSEDPNRVLYKCRFNPQFEHEYERTETKAGSPMYLVPTAELLPVHRVDTSREIKREDFSGLMDPDKDAPLDQITIRDIVAIVYQKPYSNKEWLNKIIIEEGDL